MISKSTCRPFVHGFFEVSLPAGDVGQRPLLPGARFGEADAGSSLASTQFDFQRLHSFLQLRRIDGTHLGVDHRGQR